eukprot:4684562-Prymnesium_polylepis.1
MARARQSSRYMTCKPMSCDQLMQGLADGSPHSAASKCPSSFTYQAPPPHICQDDAADGINVALTTGASHKARLATSIGCEVHER